VRWDEQRVDRDEPALLGLSGLIRSVRSPEFAGVVFHEVRAKSVLNRVPGGSPMPFSWTVNPAPSITDPGDQEVAPNGTVGLTLSTAGGTGGLTLTASGLPTWLSMDATGKFTGTAPATRGAAGTAIVKATDSLGVSASISIKWYVDDLKWTTIPDQSTQHSTSRTTRSGSLSLSGYVLGGSGTKSYALVSPPAWMSLSGSTISVTAPTSTTSKTITVKVGDGTGYSVTTSFTWTIT